jgi:hypothetical protein
MTVPLEIAWNSNKHSPLAKIGEYFSRLIHFMRFIVHTLKLK